MARRDAFQLDEAGHGYGAPLISMMLRSGSRMKSWGNPAGPSRRTMTRIGSSSAASSRKPLTVSVASAPSKSSVRNAKWESAPSTLPVRKEPVRIEGQMHLQGAAGEPGAGALEGRPLNDPEAEKILIEGERPRQIGNDEINMVERKLSHAPTITRWLGKAIRQARLRMGKPSISQENDRKRVSLRQINNPIP